MYIFVTMAYNNNNRYLRIKEMQDVYLAAKVEGVTTKHIYKTIIWPKFKVSIATFYNYMGINVRKELSQMQPRLFD